MAQIGRKGARRLPQISTSKPKPPLGQADVSMDLGIPDPNRPANYMTVWYEIKELLRRVWQLENGGGSGPGTVTSITGTAPIVVTPSPITTTGVVSITTFIASGASHARGAVPDPGSVAGTTKFLREDATFAVPPGGGATSPLTTKGDVWGYSTVDARIPIGSNGFVLTADSTQTLGLKWAAGAVSPLTTKGDVWTFSTVDTRQPIGTNGQIATVDSTNAVGWKWAAVPTSGTLQSQEFTASGTFNVPTGVTCVWVRMIGGGGGGGTTIIAANGGGGGGSGEDVDLLAIPCTSAGTITVTIGAKGTGGAAGQASAQAGTDGGDTSVAANSITYYARGGKFGPGNNTPGAGGGTRGGTSTAGNNGVLGTQESPCYFGGGSGGGGGTAVGVNGGAGAGNAGFPTGSAGGANTGSQAGGGGGSNSPWGVGGAGGAGLVIGASAAATSYGSGGGGGGGKVTTTTGGGDGCAGYVLIQWVA